MSVFNSVRFRLVLWNVGVLAIILATFGWALRLEIQRDLLNGIDAGLLKSAARTQGYLRTTGDVPSFMMQREIQLSEIKAATQNSSSPSGANTPFSFAISRIEMNGAADKHDHVILDQSTAIRSLKGETVFSTVKLNGINARVYSTPMYRYKRIVFVMQFAHNLSEFKGEMAGITRSLLTLIPLALAIVGFGALLLTERALVPVRQIVDSTERIEAKNLSGRLAITGKDEFSHLALTINGMLSRLDKAFTLLREGSEKQRRFTADASHELRTPLTIIKANTSLSLSVERTPDEYRRTLIAVDRAADRMSKIVMDLLYIARSDAAEIFIESEPVNILAAIKHSVEAVADTEGHEVLYDIDPGLWVSGDEQSLIRLFANLLQNAYKYTPQHGTITFRGSVNEHGSIIRVIDTGAGIAPQHLEHLGERFFRVDDARGRNDGGTGLGLAICRSIAESHGGSISFESVLGYGTTVIVGLPNVERQEQLRQADYVHQAKP